MGDGEELETGGLQEPRSVEEAMDFIVEEFARRGAPLHPERHEWLRSMVAERMQPRPEEQRLAGGNQEQWLARRFLSTSVLSTLVDRLVAEDRMRAAAHPGLEMFHSPPPSWLPDDGAYGEGREGEQLVLHVFRWGWGSQDALSRAVGTARLRLRLLAVASDSPVAQPTTHPPLRAALFPGRSNQPILNAWICAACEAGWLRRALEVGHGELSAAMSRTAWELDDPSSARVALDVSQSRLLELEQWPPDVTHPYLSPVSRARMASRILPDLLAPPTPPPSSRRRRWRRS